MQPGSVTLLCALLVGGKVEGDKEEEVRAQDGTASNGCDWLSSTGAVVRNGG